MATRLGRLRIGSWSRIGWLLGIAWLMTAPLSATPANRAALERHYDRFLKRGLASCTTCHLPSDRKLPESLAEFPHNPFGDRLRQVGEVIGADGKKPSISDRLLQVAAEDSDGDGINNETELLLGHNPGDAKDHPSQAELELADTRRAEFVAFCSRYAWRPFESVVRPSVPTTEGASQAKPNPIDAFLSAHWNERHLTPRPPASKETLLRRLYLDLIGLGPTPEEQRAFLADEAPDAYERCVDRLLIDPRHGERWARHWMDVWRYSDWAGWADGKQIRDSQPHIWRWRDWIVESLNADKPYNRMVVEMLAADELAPEDPTALRATGFLARNYKMLSREQWLEDTVKHTSQAFLGVTMGCSKCHDHMFDPISQREYYALRAVFEPHQVRLDRVPGQLDTTQDGLARVYDATNAPTYFFVRGDERHPLTNEAILPGVPAVLGGRLEIHPVALPPAASHPDQREFVIQDTLAASEAALEKSKRAWQLALDATNRTPASVEEAELAFEVADRRHAALLAVLAAERATPPGTPSREATNAVICQQLTRYAEAKLDHVRARAAVEKAATNQVTEARQKVVEAEKKLAAAAELAAKPLTAGYEPRASAVFPEVSTGRRLAFAQWLTDPKNPLAARVAVNHVWMRHFGRGLVSSPADFGRNGRPPTHPELLDWLAAEFMEPTITDPDGRLPAPWSFRHLHRLIVTSAAYRMASTSDPADVAIDPDNLELWRMNPRRLEAEAVRDNLLAIGDALDLTQGGPEIDFQLAQTSPRRSLYLRTAAEKQSEFLQIFDGPAVTECYERHPSVMPQQALALGNSELAVRQSRRLAETLVKQFGQDSARLVEAAFERVLARRATSEERRECMEYLVVRPISGATSENAFRRAVENLILVLVNHNDFVTVR